MATTSKTIGIIFQAKDEASAVTEKVASGLQGVGGAASNSAKNVDELAQSTEKLGRTEAVDKLNTALKALAASLVFKAFVDVNVEAEKFERAMTLLKGSSEAAGQEFVYISGVAKTLGLNLFDTADAYTSLTAATKGTSLEGAATREIFEAVSKAMSSLGKSSADTQGALLAISQMVSKGTVSMEELRGQLGERLPGAFQLAAQAMGMTTQDLDKFVSSGKLTAEEFLPKFADALRGTFGDTTMVEGYAASMNRLQTAVSEAFIEIGKTGAFDALTKAVQLGTAAVTGALASFRLLGEGIGIVLAAIASGDFSLVGDAFDASMKRAAESTRGARDALLGIKETSEVTAGSVNLFATDAQRYLQAISASATAFDEALKKAKTLDDLGRIGGQITTAFVNGELSAEEFEKRVISLAGRQAELETKTGGASKQVDEQAKALARSEAAAQKAQEAAQKYAVEMEKIASNERIKLIEAKVQIDVANIQATTERIKANFESLDNTINSTADVIKETLGLLTQAPDWATFRVLESQLETENKLRRDAFELQKALTEAQINNLNAQTLQLNRSDALIKVDGAGLQPHLEAFMWEILRSIQVRVNGQGLGLLLGVT